MFGGFTRTSSPRTARNPTARWPVMWRMSLPHQVRRFPGSGPGSYLLRRVLESVGWSSDSPSEQEWREGRMSLGRYPRPARAIELAGRRWSRALRGGRRPGGGQGRFEPRGKDARVDLDGAPITTRNGGREGRQGEGRHERRSRAWAQCRERWEGGCRPWAAKRQGLRSRGRGFGGPDRAGRARQMPYEGSRVLVGSEVLAEGVDEPRKCPETSAPARSQVQPVGEHEFGGPAIAVGHPSVEEEAWMTPEPTQHLGLLGEPGRAEHQMRLLVGSEAEVNPAKEEQEFLDPIRGARVREGRAIQDSQGGQRIPGPTARRATGHGRSGPGHGGARCGLVKPVRRYFRNTGGDKHNGPIVPGQVGSANVADPADGRGPVGRLRRHVRRAPQLVGPPYPDHGRLADLHPTGDLPA
jgi:hypothetical protein